MIKYYCSKYGGLSSSMCRKSPCNDDDWDELINPCLDCGWRKSVNLEMETFKVKCKKDHPYLGKAGDVVDAYVRADDLLVVNGFMIPIENFNEYFEE